MLSEKTSQPSRQTALVFDLAFPYHQRAPALLSYRRKLFGVSRRIACELGTPEGAVGFRDTGSPASLVPVPEAAVNENCFSPTRKSDVGFTGQLAEMEPKAVTQSVCDLTYPYLRLRVAAADGTHVGASPFFRYFVSHSANFLRSQPSTARCSSCPARRICDSSQMVVGFCPVIFFAPWLQVEHSARRFESSSLPPRFLSMTWPTCSRTLRPVAGSISPGVRPHIWQVKPLRSSTSARSFAEMPCAIAFRFSSAGFQSRDIARV